jgi:hypothetical protein
MEDDIRPRDTSVRPSRWAEGLLRLFLQPDEESQFGDLLETYRDSIHPQQGRWRADVWLVRQVPGYMLRSRTLTLRNGLLAGLGLCVLTTVFTLLRFPDLFATGGVEILAALGAAFLIYGYAAVKRARPASPEDVSVLDLGARWGITIGTLWALAYFSANLVTPHGLGMEIAILLALAGVVLPFVAGAHAAIKMNKVRAGLRVGFWSGVICGVIVFLAGAALGYILAFVPGLPGAEFPTAAHGYTPVEFQRLNVADALGGGISYWFGFGCLFSPVAGTVGGWAGLMLARTGRLPDASTRT